MLHTCSKTDGKGTDPGHSFQLLHHDGKPTLAMKRGRMDGRKKASSPRQQADDRNETRSKREQEAGDTYWTLWALALSYSSHLGLSPGHTTRRFERSDPPKDLQTCLDSTEPGQDPANR